MDVRFAKIVRDETDNRHRILIEGSVFGLDVQLTERNNELVALIVSALRQSAYGEALTGIAQAGSAEA